MQSIYFSITGNPVSKARARVRKSGWTYNTDRTKIAEQAFRLQAAKYQPVKPFEGPIRLDVAFFMPIPKSWPEKKKELARLNKIRPTSRPDRDNLLKLVQDAMNKRFWDDDAQVVEGQTEKFYSELYPRTDIGVHQLVQ